MFKQQSSIAVRFEYDKVPHDMMLMRRQMQPKVLQLWPSCVM